MAEGQLGFFAVLRHAFIHPAQLFEAWRSGAVRTPPFLVYALGFFAAHAGSAIEFGQATHNPVHGPVLFLLLVGVVLLPLGWFIGTGILHLLARLMRGKGSLRETQTAVGFGSAPRLLGVFGFLSGLGEPWLYLALFGLVGEVWCYASTAAGFMRLHQLKLWRALLALLLPIVVPVALALGLRSFVIEAFKIPAGSMQPTLQIQDHLFITKSTYGWFSPTAFPERGEIVVFTYPDPDPERPPQDFIKRVIALPGDTLEVESGAPSINGWKVPRCHLGRVTIDSVFDSGKEADVFVEFLQGHAYLVEHDVGYDSGTQGPYRVGSGEFWVMGDNRNNSSDSRAWRGGRGAGVPLDHLRGRAWFVWLPIERIGIELQASPVLPDGLKQLQPELERCLKTAPSLEQSTPPAPR